MKSKKEKLVIYSICIIAVIMILVGIIYSVKDTSYQRDLLKLEDKLLEYAKEIFKEDDLWITEDRKEFLSYVSLEDMKTYYQKDITMFQDEKVICNLKNTYIKFYANEKGSEYEVKLSCHKR